MIHDRISFTGQLSPNAVKLMTAFFDNGRAAREAVEMARIMEHSRLSGMEVIYDLSMFDEPWSPVYHHEHEGPIAWVRKDTGERRDGPAHPDL